eukprot:scaffold433_cov83-Skeletonema_dohrnii-CCMP3373.AAC.2
MHSEIVAQGFCVWQIYIPGLYDKAGVLDGHARKLGQLLDPQLCNPNYLSNFGTDPRSAGGPVEGGSSVQCIAEVPA